MSEIHQFKCNRCKTKVDSNYNGEHHLPPDGWVQLWDSNKAEMIDTHLCPKCYPKRPKEVDEYED